MKKGISSDNLGDSLIQSVTHSGACEIALDVSEMALDSALNEGYSKMYPSLDGLQSFMEHLMQYGTISFSKKVASFLVGTQSANQDAKNEFRSAMDANPDFRRKVGESLVLLLERHDHFDKSMLLGKVFSEYLCGRIDYDRF